jgi:chorismate mutase
MIIFTDIKQGSLRSSGMLLGIGGQLVVDVLGQLIRPISRVFFDCLTLEDERNRLSHNVGKKLPHHAAYRSRREKTSFKRRRKSEILHNKQEFPGMRKTSAKLSVGFYTLIMQSVH